jgi:hypothetical protein
MSVVTVYRGASRNNGKLLKVKHADKLDVPKLIKSAALKFGIKKKRGAFFNAHEDTLNFLFMFAFLKSSCWWIHLA